MPGTTLSPENWAEAAAEWNDQFFAIRVANEKQEKRLRAYLVHEDERPEATRPERIARVNKRLQSLET